MIDRFFSINIDLLCILDIDGNFIRVNEACSKLTGEQEEQIEQKHILDYTHPDDYEVIMQIRNRLYQKQDTHEFISRMKSYDGSYRHLEWRIKAYDNIVYAAARDITERHEKEMQVQYLSVHDHMTGLYNRRYMDEMLSSLTKKKKLPLAFFAVDVNGLKLVNDTFGHEMGDSLLMTVATILKNSCRQSDIICRIGGDEFAILAPNTSEQEALQIKRTIIENIKQAKLDCIVVSIAIGFDIMFSLSQDINEIQREADNRMYKNKQKFGKQMRIETIDRIVEKITTKSIVKKEHLNNVANYAEQIASALGMSAKEIELTKRAAKLHDIGKITTAVSEQSSIDAVSLDNPESVKRHSVTGYLLLKSVDEYLDLAEIVLRHHERFDGNGYPDRLRGEMIPISSRIISVAEVYDVIRYGRKGQKPKSMQESIEELRKHAGQQFDPHIVEVFINDVLLKK